MDDKLLGSVNEALKRKCDCELNLEKFRKPLAKEIEKYMNLYIEAFGKITIENPYGYDITFEYKNPKIK